MGRPQVFPEDQKRLRLCLQPGQLRELALAQSQDWDRLVAVAHWQAEELCAGPFDEVAACDRFERNPWRWENSDGGRPSQAEFTVLWAWRDSQGQPQRSFLFPELHHVFARGVPAPLRMSEDNAGLYRALLQLAATETVVRKVPCVYLGAQIAENRFESDPAKWACQGKKRVRAWFEFPGVSVEGKAYRVSLEIHNISQHNRSVPRSPLSHWAFTRATFTVDFFNAVASNVRKGIQFKGIAYESERPTILEQLPCGGVDVQDEPVFWTLHDGRVVCWSVRDLSKAKEDLEPADSLERYKAVAKELGYDVLGRAMDEASVFICFFLLAWLVLLI